jgi:hypothetical protein
MQPKEEIKLIVRPEKVILHEQLTYRVVIDARAETTLLRTNGTLEVHLPIDGEKYFGADALKQVAALKADRPAESALIGYAGFSNYQRTSLDAYAPSQEFQPIKIPVKIPIADMDRLVATSSLCTTSLGYVIKDPAGMPISMDAILFDDRGNKEGPARTSTSFQEQLQLRLTIHSDIGNLSQAVKDKILGEIRQSKEDAQKAQADAQKQISGTGKDPAAELVQSRADADDLLKRLTDIQKQLEEMAGQSAEKFTIENVVQVIDNALKTGEQSPAQATHEKLKELHDFVEANLDTARLVYLRLKWPYAEQEASHTPLSGVQGWRYNPESGQIEKRDVRLEWDSNARIYQTDILLNLYRPAGEYPKVEGDMLLQTGKPLSGLNVQWLDTDEDEVKGLQVEYQTSIRVEIEKIDLADVFRRRTFSPSRHLHFKSVVPSLNRLRDVESALNDAGLTIQKITYGDSDVDNDVDNNDVDNNVDFAKGCWITAVKRGIGKTMVIWVCVSGTTTTGTHKVSYDNDRQQLDEQVQLGDTEVRLFAHVTGDSTNINAILNDVQEHLKRRFAAVRVV